MTHSMDAELPGAGRSSTLQLAPPGSIKEIVKLAFESSDKALGKRKYPKIIDTLSVTPLEVIVAKGAFVNRIKPTTIDPCRSKITSAFGAAQENFMYPEAPLFLACST